MRLVMGTIMWSVMGSVMVHGINHAVGLYNNRVYMSTCYTGLYYRPAAAANLSDLDILSARDARASGDGPTCNVVQLQAMEWDLQCEGTLLVESR